MEFSAVFFQKSAEARRVLRRDSSNLPLHSIYVRGSVQLTARAENDPVLWVQTDQFNLLA
jgi:hypothetical protein